VKDRVYQLAICEVDDGRLVADGIRCMVRMTPQFMEQCTKGQVMDEFQLALNEVLHLAFSEKALPGVDA
jgi:hypothetical protein